MNKAGLINYVSDEVAISKKEAKIVIDAVLDGIRGGIVNEGKVTLVGFGTFELAKRNARVARNPKTGERIDVPEKTVPKFRPSASLKAQALGAEVPGEVEEVEEVGEIIEEVGDDDLSELK